MPGPRSLIRPNAVIVIVIVIVLVIVLVAVLTGCTGAADVSEGGDATSARETVTGPLCDALPMGTDPGAPALLEDEPADVALQWIPVLTLFEAGTRATGLDAELRQMEDVTILAPTDDAFARTFTQGTLDDLLLFRHDELRVLLEGHVVRGDRSLASLLAMDTVTTVAGHTLTVTAEGPMPRFDDRAEIVCADYRVANARIHVVDAVLGELPEPADETDPATG